MKSSSAKRQAAGAIAAALLLAGAWAMFGTGLRVRWMVALGAPPVRPEKGDEYAAQIRALGAPARPILLEEFRGRASRARKSWVASLLLAAPFYARAEIEAGLASPDAATARAAAFALMHGQEEGESFEVTVGRMQSPAEQRTPRAPLDPWDPAPAVPVLVAWLADREDPEGQQAARLLGQVAPSDGRATEALLACVEEVPSLLAPGAPPAHLRRKIVVVAALQSLLARVHQDPAVVDRVMKVVAWIAEKGETKLNYDIAGYGLRLLEVTRGRGLPPGLLERLAGDPTTELRMRVAGTAEEIPGPEATALLERLTADREPMVRRSAVLALKKRKDEVLFRLAPRLVEDSYIFVCADTLVALGEMWMAHPAACKEALPLLVSCLEEPWPGEPPPAGSKMAEFLEQGRADVVAACIGSLFRITRSETGFRKTDLEDWRTLETLSRDLAKDGAKRAAMVAEWRKTVPERPPAARLPFLLQRTEEMDFDVVVRCVREIARLLGDREGVPAAVFTRTADDTEARNALREWRKSGAEKAWRERIAPKVAAATPPR